MAKSNRVFVSPGIYTSERELTFVAQSIGVTTLGLVGETLTGPAFEPVLIKDFNEFRLFFGTTSPTKDENGAPKYELPYVAKSYLEESNQLFVTRVLGLTGYRAGKTFVLKTIASGTTFNNKVAVAFRSRGHYSGNTLVYEVTSVAEIAVSPTDVETDPYADFNITVTGLTGGVKEFICNMDPASSKFVTKVFGTTNFDKTRDEFPIYVHEVYSSFYRAAYNEQVLTGLETTVYEINENSNFLGEYDTPKSPMIVSEVRGGKVNDLFEIMTISDGDGANYESKVTIANINLETLEFDVLVRDYYDTDDNTVVLEKFSRCSMNPDLPGYVAKKIGTAEGDYELKSKFVMLVMAQNHPIDAVPAGFRGYPAIPVSGGITQGAVNYKVEYWDAGDIIAYDLAGTPIISSGDRIKRVSLGWSTQAGYDDSLLEYKGLAASGTTDGFHLSVNATGITGETIFQTTPYDLEGDDKGKLEDLNAVRFTIAMAGGFDGWDVYRGSRTNTDDFIFGKSAYTGSTTGLTGVFDPAAGNSDYYAYLEGIRTFANPEAIDINVFATPGLNFTDHLSLTIQAIDMVENDRADSIYIAACPNVATADDAVDALDTSNLDSNYTSTYWPWIQIKDVDNQAQIYIPATAEVVRNIALTDNVSYPWFAVAGYNRGIVKSQKAFKKLNLDERDELYKNRINPIATFADTGTIIWGNKTLQVKESPLDRMNVRRLLLRARKLISAVAIRLLFEQNDEQVRNEFLRLVNPIMEAIKRERGVYEFRVTVSNDPEDIDTNTMRGKIYLKPTKALEFIDVEFVITPTGASFENI